MQNLQSKNYRRLLQISNLYHLFIAVYVLSKLTNWAEKLVISKTLSVVTNESIKSGVLTPKAQSEIVHSLATLTMVHTIRPTTNDLNTVCTRLIKMYPILKDTMDNGYVSFIGKSMLVDKIIEFQIRY